MKKLNVLLGVLMLMVVLTACGDGGVKSGVVEVIEYDELINKLDNEESFFLITTDATIEDVEKTGAINLFEENLKEHNQGAYLVSLDGVDYSELESDYNKDEDKVHYSDYAHPKQEVAKVWWSPRMDGLSYVEDGKVINTHMMHLQERTEFFTDLDKVSIKRQSENESNEFEFEIKEMVDIRINNLNQLDIEVK